MLLQERSMLVDLTISRWTATKHDKVVSAEVEQKHSAHNAGRYNKRLVDKTHLADIDAAANALRKAHYTRTLPWNDRGQRLLPSDLYMDYRNEIRVHRDAFNKAVSVFVQRYPQLVQDARTRLQSLYRPEDYPSAHELHALFDVSIEYSPVPAAQDFRTDIAQEEQDEIRRQIEQSVQARQALVVKDCWSRVREVVERVAEQCGKDKPIIHDSLMGNINDLTAILHGLNITNDPQIAAAEQNLRDLVVPVERLRESATIRRLTGKQAQAILMSIPA